MYCSLLNAGRSVLVLWYTEIYFLCKKWVNIYVFFTFNTVTTLNQLFNNSSFDEIGKWLIWLVILMKNLLSVFRFNRFFWRKEKVCFFFKRKFYPWNEVQNMKKWLNTSCIARLLKESFHNVYFNARNNIYDMLQWTETRFLWFLFVLCIY